MILGTGIGVRWRAQFPSALSPLLPRHQATIYRLLSLGVELLASVSRCEEVGFGKNLQVIVYNMWQSRNSELHDNITYFGQSKMTGK